MEKNVNDLEIIEKKIQWIIIVVKYKQLHDN